MDLKLSSGPEARSGAPKRTKISANGDYFMSGGAASFDLNMTEEDPEKPVWSPDTQK